MIKIKKYKERKFVVPVKIDDGSNWEAVGLLECSLERVVVDTKESG